MLLSVSSMDGHGSLKLEKIVSLLGSWKSNTLSENLSYEISKRADNIRGRTSKLVLLEKGLKLHVRNQTGQIDESDLIPFQSIYDIFLNKYNAYIILCLIKGGNRGLNIVAFRCRSELDSLEIKRVFRQCKETASGDGYNSKLKNQHDKNWSLSKKTGFQVTHNSDISNCSVNGKHSQTCVRRLNSVPPEVSEIGVQTDVSEEDHVSISTQNSESSRDELSQLSGEVQAIKLIFENENEISSPNYYRKEIRQEDDRKELYYHEIMPTVSRGEFVAAKSTGIENQTANSNGIKPRSEILGVNKDEVAVCDIRSIGVQTPTYKVSGKRDDNDLKESNMEVNHVRARTSYRSRTASEVSDMHTADVLQYGNMGLQNGHTKSNKILTFITPPPERQYNRMEDRLIKHPVQRHSQTKRYVEFSTTVPRSIENVYPLRKKSRRKSEKYRHLVLPSTFVDDVVYHDPVRSFTEMSSRPVDVHKLES